MRIEDLNIPKIYEFDLRGAKVAVLPVDVMGTVGMQVLIKAGSWYEKTKGWGAFHLLEHLAGSKTRKFKDRAALEDFCEEFGISHRASAGGASLKYYFKSPFYNFDQMLALFEETIFNAQIDKQHLDREIPIIFREYKDKWDMPNNKYNKAVDEAIFGKNHIYVRDGIGQPNYVKLLSTDDLRALHETYFTPNNLVISIAGKVDPVKAKEKLEVLLKCHAPKKPLGELPHPPVKPETSSLWYQDNVKSATVNLIWQIPGRAKSSLLDRMEFRVLSYLLGGGGLRSLLYKKLRQELGLVYFVGTHTWFLPTYGGFEVRLQTDLENVEECISTAREVVGSLAKKGIDSKSFGRSKNFMGMRTLLSYDSVDAITRVLANSLFWEGRVVDPEEYLQMAESIEADEIREKAARYLASHKPFVAIRSSKTPKNLQ